MKKKSIISLILVTMLVCTFFSGCTDKNGAIVLKVGDKEFNEGMYLSAIAYADMYLAQQSGASYAESLDEEFDGKKGADILKEQAEGLIRQMEASRKVALDNGVTLTDEDKEVIDEQKQASVDQLGGRKAFIEDLEARGMTEEFFDYIMEASYLYSKYTQSFDVTSEEILSLVEAGGYVRVKHVLIQADSSAADFAGKKALAEDIAKRAAAGEDFDALVAEYGEDPGMQSYPYGYIINQSGYTTDGQTQMMQEFTDGSVALAVGEVSAPVQTAYGFHIIKRYPIDAASLADTTPVDFGGEAGGETIAMGTLIKYEFMDMALGIKLMSVEEGLEVEKMEALDNVDIHGFFDDLKEKQENISHEGHDH